MANKIITIIILTLLAVSIFAGFVSALDKNYNINEIPYDNSYDSGTLTPVYAQGDVNADGLVDEKDLDILVNYIFRGGPEPDSVMGDLNNDGFVNILDLTNLVDILYRSDSEESEMRVKINGFEIPDSLAFIVPGITNFFEIEFTAPIDSKDVQVKIEINGENINFKIQSITFDIVGGDNYRETLQVQMPFDPLVQYGNEAVVSVKINGDNYQTSKEFSVNVITPIYPIDPTVTPKLTGIFSDYGWDTNENGLFDHLIINVGTYINEIGSYKITGKLTDSEGKTIEYKTKFGIISNSNLIISNVPLHFSGIEINKNEMNGPYTLEEVILYDEDTNTILDQLSNAYTTPYYSYNEFENFKKGDVNGDGQVNRDDLDFLVDYIFRGGPAPDPVLGDLNEDGRSSTILDLTYLIDLLFRSPPIIELLDPDDGDVLRTSRSDIDVDFEYIVRDESEIARCSLVVAGRVEETKNNVVRDSMNFFEFELDSGEEYGWRL